MINSMDYLYHRLKLKDQGNEILEKKKTKGF
jgi:hypothetical protein